MSNKNSDDARAAARLVEIPSQMVSNVPRQSVRGMVDDEGWAAIAHTVVSASSVLAVGVVPEPLIEAIRRELETDESKYLPAFEYFTPSPELALNLGRSLHRYTVRWQAGYLGLRNLVMAGRAKGSSSTATVEYRHFGYGAPGLSFSCLLHLGSAAGPIHAILLTEMLGRGDRPTYVAHSLPAADSQIAAYLDDVRRDSRPIRLREVRCHELAEAEGADGVQSRLRMGELVPLAGVVRTPNTLRPVAIIVVRSKSPGGMEIVLKRRTPLTDTDDFGKLSLLSARVQEGDVAAALGASVSPSHESDDAAFDDLWLAAGSPMPFFLPVDAFRVAAQREALMTLGLHIDMDRLVVKGLRLVQHESAFVQQMAFMVFVLDLVRSSQVDELRAALERNSPNLHRLPANDVYANEGELNRLLRQKKPWLIENCFSG